jgi:hypothetical protein
LFEYSKNENVDQKKENENWKEQAKDDIQRRIESKFPNVSLATDVIDWWRQNWSFYPFISRVANKVLSIPASSSAVHSFSVSFQSKGC